MKNAKHIFVSIVFITALVLITSLISAKHANAAWLVNDDFNTYSNGGIVGQGSWSSYANGSNFIVQNTNVFEGTKALYNNASADSIITKLGTPLSDGGQSVYVRTQNRSSWGTYANGNAQVRISRGSWGGSELRNFIAASFKSDGNVAYYDPASDAYTNFSTYNDNEWTLLEFEWRSTDKKARYRVNNGTWTDWKSIAGSASFTDFDTVGFDSIYLSGSGGVYIDSLSSMPACLEDVWSCDEWNSCSVNGTQTRTCTKTSNCTSVETPSPTTSQSCVYTPPTCISWTYSNWSSCSVDKQQTRTVTSSSPANCTGGNPVLSQSCIPTPITCSSWIYSDWSQCSNGQQTRTTVSASPDGCSGGNPVTSQTCTLSPLMCTSWTYSEWSSCSVSGEQARTVVSAIPATCAGGIPILKQSCTPSPVKKNPYICYPSCDASTCVNDSCISRGAADANVGDRISLVHRDLNLAKRVIIGDVLINNWTVNREGLILEFVLPDGLKTGMAFVDVYDDTETGLITHGWLNIKTKSILPLPPSCLEDKWSCNDWNACSASGTQTRSCTKSFDCPTAETSSPATSQNCTPPQSACSTDTWTCGRWDVCSLSGIQNRSCAKTFDCPSAETAPPTISQYCESPNRPQQAPPTDSGEVTNQDTIVKATVKLLCPVDARMASQGSGTIIDPSGTILTNKHVIAGTVGCFVGFVDSFGDDPYFGDRQIADITKTSPSQDVAILKLRNPQNKRLPSVNIEGASSNLRLGTRIVTYGYPASFGRNMTYTSGDFSGSDGAYLKTTAIIEHGNSGGGAYLTNGTYIGIPSMVRRGELNALGYILSINTINAWLNNSGIAHSGESNNQYSRVSVLEDMDLKQLGSLQLFVPETDASGNLVAPVIPATNQKTKKSFLASTITILNVRQSPSPSAKIVSRIKKGVPYSIIETKKDWHRIKISNKLSGWVMKKFVKLVPSR